MIKPLSPTPSGWKYDLLDNLAKRGSGHTPDRGKPEYWNGGIKWVSLTDSDKLDRRWIKETTSEISSLGIRHSSAVLHPKNTVILSRDAGVGKSAVLAEPMAVSQHFMAWQCGPDLDPFMLYYWLQRHKGFFERMAVGSTIQTIGLGVFKKLTGTFPPLPEQRKIADILSTWDEALEKLDALIEAKERRKKALMQQLLTGKRRLKGYDRSKGKTSGDRFGSYPTDWRKVALGAITKELSNRNPDSHDLPVLSCTKHEGLVLSEEYFGRRVYASDTSNYRMVKRGEFAYATNHIEEGSIGYQDICDAGLVSPIYTVFKTVGEVDDNYLFRVLKSPLLVHLYRANTSASVDRRGSLRYDEFAAIHIWLPSKPEQIAIAKVLAGCDEELDLLRTKRTALDQQKRGLMQKLLTGTIRVKP